MIQLPPDPEIEPEIAREMKIELLEEPEPFEGRIRRHDLEEYDKLDQKGRQILIENSVFQQWLDWLAQATLVQNRQLRYLEVFLIRQSRLLAETREENKKTGWQWGLAKWTIMALAAGMIAGWTKSIFGK